MLLINLSHLTFDVYLVFFGAWCVLLGYLIIGSTFVPRAIGVLLVADGIGWMRERHVSRVGAETLLTRNMLLW